MKAQIVNGVLILEPENSLELLEVRAWAAEFFLGLTPDNCDDSIEVIETEHIAIDYHGVLVPLSC